MLEPYAVKITRAVLSGRRHNEAPRWLPPLLNSHFACVNRRTHSLIYVYWLLAVPTGLLASVVILLTISGQRLSSVTPDWLALAASGAVLALLSWGYNLGTSGGRPFVAALLVVLSWILFAGAMLINGLMNQKIWN